MDITTLSKGFKFLFIILILQSCQKPSNYESTKPSPTSCNGLNLIQAKFTASYIKKSTECLNSLAIADGKNGIPFTSKFLSDLTEGELQSILNFILIPKERRNENNLLMNRLELYEHIAGIPIKSTNLQLADSEYDHFLDFISRVSSRIHRKKSQVPWDSLAFRTIDYLKHVDISNIFDLLAQFDREKNNGIDVLKSTLNDKNFFSMLGNDRLLLSSRRDVINYLQKKPRNTNTLDLSQVVLDQNQQKYEFLRRFIIGNEDISRWIFDLAVKILSVLYKQDAMQHVFPAIQKLVRNSDLNDISIRIFGLLHQNETTQMSDHIDLLEKIKSIVLENPQFLGSLSLKAASSYFQDKVENIDANKFSSKIKKEIYKSSEEIIQFASEISYKSPKFTVKTREFIVDSLRHEFEYSNTYGAGRYLEMNLTQEEQETILQLVNESSIENIGEFYNLSNSISDKLGLKKDFLDSLLLNKLEDLQARLYSFNGLIPEGAEEDTYKLNRIVNGLYPDSPLLSGLQQFVDKRVRTKTLASQTTRIVSKFKNPRYIQDDNAVYEILQIGSHKNSAVKINHSLDYFYREDIHPSLRKTLRDGSSGNSMHKFNLSLRGIGLRENKVAQFNSTIKNQSDLKETLKLLSEEMEFASFPFEIDKLLANIDKKREIDKSKSLIVSQEYSTSEFLYILDQLLKIQLGPKIFAHGLNESFEKDELYYARFYNVSKYAIPKLQRYADYASYKTISRYNVNQCQYYPSIRSQDELSHKIQSLNSQASVDKLASIQEVEDLDIDLKLTSPLHAILFVMKKNREMYTTSSFSLKNQKCMNKLSEPIDCLYQIHSHQDLESIFCSYLSDSVCRFASYVENNEQKSIFDQFGIDLNRCSGDESKLFSSHLLKEKAFSNHYIMNVFNSIFSYGKNPRLSDELMALKRYLERNTLYHNLPNTTVDELNYFKWVKTTEFNLISDKSFSRNNLFFHFLLNRYGYIEGNEYLTGLDYNGFNFLILTRKAVDDFFSFILDSKRINEKPLTVLIEYLKNLSIDDVFVFSHVLSNPESIEFRSLVQNRVGEFISLIQEELKLIDSDWTENPKYSWFNHLLNKSTFDIIDAFKPLMTANILNQILLDLRNHLSKMPVKDSVDLFVPIFQIFTAIQKEDSQRFVEKQLELIKNVSKNVLINKSISELINNLSSYNFKTSFDVDKITNVIYQSLKYFLDVVVDHFDENTWKDVRYFSNQLADNPNAMKVLLSLLNISEKSGLYDQITKTHSNDTLKIVKILARQESEDIKKMLHEAKDFLEDVQAILIYIKNNMRYDSQNGGYEMNLFSKSLEIVEKLSYSIDFYYSLIARSE